MADYQKISDDELINLLKESDHAAYNEIYKRHFYLTYLHAYKTLGDQEQAKDIVQEVFATLWFKREFIQPIANIAAYLYVAVRNKIFDLIAHQKVEGKYLDSLENFLKTCSGVPTDHRIRERQLEAYIEKQIQQLPPKMKQIFEMSRKANLSHKEIAQELNTSENNVSKQLNTALRVLKTKLGMFINLMLIVF